MAFDRKDGFSYLDNIPFKISSAFTPPPPVVLPSVLNTNEEFPFEKFQYDFSKEKEVLEDIKNKEECAKQARENALKTEIKGNTSENSGQHPSSKANVQNMFSLQSDILLPKPQKVLDKVSDTDNQNNSKINLSDFENDTSSPFDYMELQTINDLEELSNVFQGLNNKYSSDDNVYKDKNSTSDGLNENNLASNVSKSMSFPLQNNDGFENSEKYLTCPKEADVRGYDVWSASLSLPREDCFYPVPAATHIDDLGSESQGQSLERTLTSATPKVPCLPFPSVKNNVENGLTSKSALRGCKSYSDIHQLSEHPEDSLKQIRASTPPSNMFTAIEVKPSPSSMTKNEISSGDVNCDNSSTLSDLPDPYNELTEDDRRFVDAIADMGFSRAQVSRSVKHLGSDEKTVVEHLCQIQTLEESGYDCLEAEAALHLHDYNQDQAKQFLDLINKFQDLGFEKNAVKKALIQNKNDWSKTIDALLS